jgi:hypothetical protein
MLQVHYCDRNDRDLVVSIEEKKYRELLTSFDGEELAAQFFNNATIVERDPRMSDLEDCEVFFSDVDVRTGITNAAQLMEEL